MISTATCHCCLAPYCMAVPAGMSGKEATHYWYARAHRALKQRWSDPQQMLREYQHVCALDDAIEHSAAVAKSRAASGRNRYCNVLPYDFNRCALAAACRNSSSLRERQQMAGSRRGMFLQASSAACAGCAEYRCSKQSQLYCSQIVAAVLQAA
jgi:hypothetical protein